MMVLILASLFTILSHGAVIVISSLSKIQNSWDEKFTFKAGDNAMITGMQSYPDDTIGERRWRFNYGFAEGVKCYQHEWTPWVNDLEEVLDFTCDEGQVLSAIRASHSKGREDRRWKFRCCSVFSNFKLIKPRTTSFSHRWNDVLTFRCGVSEVLHGFWSEYRAGDRWWKARCIALADNDDEVIFSNSTLFDYNWLERDMVYDGSAATYDGEALYKSAVLSGLKSDTVNFFHAVYPSWLSFECMGSQFSDWLNDFGWFFDAQCDANMAIDGLWRYWVEEQDIADTRYKMSCCDITNGGSFTITAIYKSDWYDSGMVDFQCGYMEVLVGIKSFFLHGERWFELSCGRLVPNENAESINRTLVSWSEDYLNSWDGILDYTTSDHEFIVGFESKHDSSKGDRRWKIGTASLPGAFCFPGSWSSFVNNYDYLLDYICPPNHALAGVYSIHSNEERDRRWKFKCCDISATGFFKLASPVAVPQANFFDDDMSEQCAQDSVIVGAMSDPHYFMYGDRNWYFYCSQLINLYWQ